MKDSVLFAAAEALVSRELGVDTVYRSGGELCFLYDNSYIEVLPSERINEQEPPLFNILQPASDDCPPDVSIFAVNQGLDWDFYIMRSSLLTSCSEGQSCVSLPWVEPVSLHAKIGGIKQAVNLACSI